MDIIDQIRLRFPEYLVQHGVILDKNGFAHCPLHADVKTKSLHMMPGSGGQAVHCFGCDKTWNIFQFAEELEGLPKSGSEFFTVTLPELATRFGLKYTQKLIQPKDVSISKIRQIMSYTRQQLEVDDIVKVFLKERAIPEKVAKRFGIGRITDYHVLIRKLKRKFSEEDMKTSGIMMPNMFFDRVLFTLFNDFGAPIGFTGRYIGNDELAAKYVNSRNNILYNKSQHLFNYHLAKKYTKLYVVEGQIDVIRLAVNNILNVTAVGGTAVTDEHIRRLAAHQVIPVFDGDKAGIKKISTLLEKIPNCRPVLLPNQHDPDSYIRNYGKDAFLSLEELDHLSWLILQDDFHQPAAKAKEYLYKISKTNVITHGGYLRKLAKMSKIDYVLLKEGLKQIRSAKSWKILQTIIDGKYNINELNITIN